MATLKQQIYSLADSDLMAVWERVCDLYNFHDDRVYANDEEFINDIWSPTPNEALRAAHFGDYNWSHEYVKFDGYGNLESSNDLMELIDGSQIEPCVEEFPDEFSEWFDLEDSEEGEDENRAPERVVIEDFDGAFYLYDESGSVVDDPEPFDSYEDARQYAIDNGYNVVESFYL